MSNATTFPVIILGAGAAGLFCAGELGRRGVPSLVLDHAAKPAEKVRISGGGRCNFTNLHTAPDRFLSENPHFAKSALARYTPSDFLTVLARHRIGWHEKTLGQLFCDEKSPRIIRMLLDDLEAGGGTLKLAVSVSDIAREADGFRVETSEGVYRTRALVVATGGLSIPKMGATGFAYDLAERFGHRIVKPRPALVPFVFTGTEKENFAALAGVSTSVRASAGGARFDEAMLFTHRGLSGPAILQASSYWREGEEIRIDLFAGRAPDWRVEKRDRPRTPTAALLDDLAPKRLADHLMTLDPAPTAARLADVPDKTLDRFAAALSDWRLKPAGTEGWRTAEVTAGGLDTGDLSSKTMESRHAPGLYFIGECVDVTGWLGGYNFQWAWASAFAAAEALARHR
ncbi:MAG: NAD(P)/FAD-dependent oxidoreductase [Pseudomonadota bacterium]